jgi:hypothetical protein
MKKAGDGFALRGIGEFGDGGAGALEAAGTYVDGALEGAVDVGDGD